MPRLPPASSASPGTVMCKLQRDVCNSLPCGGDDEDLARENVKDDLGGKGEITLTVDSVDADTEEFGGQFVAIQPSDTDMGSKDPLDVKIIGELYGRKA